MRARNKSSRISIITLGCPKNLVDSEVLMGQLKAGGMSPEHDPEQISSECVIINTCGFIHDAKVESIETILRFAQAKKEGRIRELYVMGCLSQRYREELIREIPEVDRFFGVNELEAITRQLGMDYRKELVGERLLSTPSHYAYLKISEGCDRTCAFCAIPLIRGPHISKPMEVIVEEAQQLALRGVKELILIAQDTTYYGLDLYKKRMLPDLLIKLTHVEGIEWIRIHYTYPANFPRKLAEVIRESPKICKYVDIPVQHFSNRILKAMRRGHNQKQTIELLHYLRKNIPGVALRTSVITGFPGETEEEFNELCQFIKKIKFERLGVFTYSHEENTTAFKFDDDIPAKVKKHRANRIMKIQQKISAEINQQRIGMVLKTIIDRKEGKYWIGRSEFDSPEVDNEILIPESYPLKTGEFYNIRITEAETYDLFGIPENTV